MGDLISRRSAIEALSTPHGILYPIRTVEQLPSAQPDLDEWCTDCKEYDKEKHHCPRFNRVIREAVRDAQLKRKKGKWIPQDYNIRNGSISTCVYYYPVCSECGKSGNEDYSYCPNCGADMRGEQDGRNE